MIKAVKEANIAMALVCVLFGLLAWFGSAMTLGCFMDADKRNPIGLYCSQMASGFTAVSMPAGVGPAFVNLQFLRKSGYRNTAATAIMSAVWAVQGGTTIILLLLIGILTGRNTLSGMIPTNTLILVITIVALVISAPWPFPRCGTSSRRSTCHRQVLRTQSRQRVVPPEGAGLRHPRRIGAQHLDRIGILDCIDGFRMPHQSGGDHIHLPAGEYARFRSADTRRPWRGRSRVVRGLHRRGHPLHHRRLRYSRLPNRLLLAENSNGSRGYELAGQA